MHNPRLTPWLPRALVSAASRLPTRGPFGGRARRALSCRLTAACVAALATIAGCGGEDSSGGTTTTTSLGGAGGAGGASTTTDTSSGGAPSGSLEADYCAPLAALVCHRLATCGCGFLLPSGALDETACVAGYTDRCLQAYAPVASSVAAGTARILADSAHACVELLDASTPGCERPRGSVAQALCPTWFTADTPLGAACDFPICAGGQGICTNGSCAPRPASGEPCAQGGVCAEGLLCIAGACAGPEPKGGVCDTDDACAPPLHCVGGLCAALNASGGDCADASACALGLVCQAPTCVDRPPGPCDDAAPCGNETSCAAPRVCELKGATGASCDQDEACQPGFYCDQGAAECVEGPPLGQPCVNAVLCGPGLACDNDNGNCVSLPGDGQPCAFGAMGPSLCQDGLGCNAGTCGPLPGDGQPCTLDYRCASGLGCDFAANGSFCVPLTGQGGACQTDRTCEAGSFCDFSKSECAAVRPAGSPCKDGNECGPAGSCMPGNGGSFECAPLPGAGQRCLFDCQSGLHCSSDLAASVCLPDVCKEL